MTKIVEPHLSTYNSEKGGKDGIDIMLSSKYIYIYICVCVQIIYQVFI